MSRTWGTAATVPLICRAYGLPEPEAEVRFHPTRRWRFDWAWRDARVALEINGGVWTKGRHTRGAGYLRDLEKLNAAQLAGWIVLQCQPQDVANGTVAGLLIEALHQKWPQKASSGPQERRTAMECGASMDNLSDTPRQARSSCTRVYQKRDNQVGTRGEGETRRAPAIPPTGGKTTSDRVSPRHD